MAMKSAVAMLSCSNGYSSGKPSSSPSTSPVAGSTSKACMAGRKQHNTAQSQHQQQQQHCPDIHGMRDRHRNPKWIVLHSARRQRAPSSAKHSTSSSAKYSNTQPSSRTATQENSRAYHHKHIQHNPESKAWMDSRKRHNATQSQHQTQEQQHHRAATPQSSSSTQQNTKASAQQHQQQHEYTNIDIQSPDTA